MSGMLAILAGIVLGDYLWNFRSCPVIYTATADNDCKEYKQH